MIADQGQLKKQNNEKKVKYKQKLLNNKNNNIDEKELQNNYLELLTKLIERKDKVIILKQCKKLGDNNNKIIIQCIEEILKINKYDLHESSEQFYQINIIANQQNSTYNQLNSIFRGFLNFWTILQPQFFDFQQQIFQLINYIHNWLHIVLVRYCIDNITKYFPWKYKYCQQQIQKLIKQIFQNRKQNYFKIPLLIHQFELQQKFDIKDIILALDSCQYSRIKYFFSNKKQQPKYNIINQYIKFSINKKQQKNASKLIKKYNLNIQQYPKLIIKLQNSYLRYLVRNYQIQFIQDKLKYNINLIKLIIQILYQNKKKISANYLNKKYILKQQLKQLQYINILQKYDKFGPTQNIVFQSDIYYFQLSDFGIQRNDVIWVDLNNIQDINIDSFAEKYIGLDCQTFGGNHSLEQCILSLAQISYKNKIYIFDVLSLKLNKHFFKLIEIIFQTSIVVGQSVDGDIVSLAKAIKLPYNIKKIKIIDTYTVFKEKFPKQTKFSLAAICLKVLGKQMSKYQQCSGWANRPLRLCQLHYAALDSFMPLMIINKLEIK